MIDESAAPNVRHAEVHRGDSLQRVALRELGDASRWVELVLLNELRPPYIAAEPSAGVLGWGDYIKVPAPSSSISADADPIAVFGTDLKLTRGQLTAVDGDIELVSGIPNLSQALALHVTVDKGELAFHPTFGCWVRSLLGDIGGSRSARLAAFYIKSALIEDARVSEVQSCVAEYAGDQIRVTARVVPISGSPVDLNMVV